MNPIDAQCPFLLQRIEELRAEIALLSEPGELRQCRQQLRTLQERARQLGCYGPHCALPKVRAEPA